MRKWPGGRGRGKSNMQADERKRILQIPANTSSTNLCDKSDKAVTSTGCLFFSCLGVPHRLKYPICRFRERPASDDSQRVCMMHLGKTSLLVQGSRPRPDGPIFPIFRDLAQDRRVLPGTSVGTHWVALTPNRLGPRAWIEEVRQRTTKTCNWHGQGIV